MACAPNFANRTMWTRDNLDVLRGLNSASIDLVYADPPFNSNKNYEAPIGSKAAGAAFKDTWTLSDVDRRGTGRSQSASQRSTRRSTTPGSCTARG